jgi:hypothetical protein
MRALFSDRRGVSAVEFALVAPVLVALVLGVTEVGRLIVQADAVEKSLRSGAVFAARSELPLDATAETTIENLVKTGTADGTGAFLVPGWAEEGASLTIEPIEVDVDGNEVTIIRLTASVPFDALVPALMKTMGMDDLKIVSSHEQTYLGL